ncbi:hypothetical protein FOMG_08875 [Fusarium oxysporum f. sp. melonis 26406]|uniref:Uncharacterized protein n=1 Tax=Fusarium oxysporum f. sp. melonis 26406 TaxID=1089452 RepID=X0A485_FUSOX|nr:hypothetical protein FOMG_08875 [Fusarium oxysporum f. sp. melonis 26406]
MNTDEPLEVTKQSQRKLNMPGMDLDRDTLGGLYELRRSDSHLPYMDISEPLH